MKMGLIALLALTSTSAMAGGFSNAAVLIGIDVVLAGTSGFMLYGDFGNAAGCANGNSIFVKATHPQYAALYAMALTAFTSGSKIIAYAGGCEPVGWYSVPTITYNILLDGQSLYIRN